jgi:hypothetical protein
MTKAPKIEKGITIKGPPKIEKGIPIPVHHKTRDKDLEYNDTWLKLKPGDSIFYGLEGRNSIYMQAKLLLWKKQFLKEHNLEWEIITRMVEGGVRIWRVK